MQHTSHILMIKPVRFDFNPETAVNNRFQSKSSDTSVQEKALSEFEIFIDTLRENDIDVTVIEDTADPYTPDSVFPNNWISFHENGSILLYPMFAQNRRKERKKHVLDTVKNKFRIDQIIDLSGYEKDHAFFEGTGSMVLDRENKIAYACLSPRTDQKVLDAFCSRMNYSSIIFTAVDMHDQPVYHTNVMMCVADELVVICLDSIKDLSEKKLLNDSFSQTKKQVMEISFEQMNHFAGNMLQVHNKNGKKFLVMSTQAFHSLKKEQVGLITKFNSIIHADLTTIETNGGGSARCMMAEVFLPVK
jgi:hypothetical protein